MGGWVGARAWRGRIRRPATQCGAGGRAGGAGGAPGLGFVRQAATSLRPGLTPLAASRPTSNWASTTLDATQERMLTLGAVLPSFQPRPDVWRVLLDPAGHPFCLPTPESKPVPHRLRLSPCRWRKVERESRSGEEPARPPRTRAGRAAHACSR
ncbi:VOC family protein [Streptomyces sp.]|uniref:VOC family protein n=1 Tax=Streptomyces sp. TaxID=1931 RepID=UPI0039C95AC6